MSIKLTRDQRQRVKLAVSQIDTASDALDELHTELIEQHSTATERRIRRGTPTPKSTAQALDETQAITEVFRVLSDVMRVNRLVEGLAPRRRTIPWARVPRKNRKR